MTKKEFSEEELRAKEKREQAIAQDVTQDFLQRREERRALENGWALNINFFSGNQYCDVAPSGDLVEEDKRFYWQSRRVFNHIAPTWIRVLQSWKDKNPFCVCVLFRTKKGICRRPSWRRGC